MSPATPGTPRRDNPANVTEAEASATPGADLSSAVQALAQATQALETTATRMKDVIQTMKRSPNVGPEAAGEAAPGASPAQSRTSPKPSVGRTPPGQDEEARLFYKRLEQTGQLVDVDVDTDLSTLPPRVTHIRRPDGTVERIGFSSSPYNVG